MKKFSLKSSRFLLISFASALLSLGISAQSPDVSFPTPVETNEINGTIRARDIGDSRVTSYFYTFDGGQGDLFINVVTSNFSGDIDVFAADALRPLTKMVIYPDGGTNETGRLIYLRKGERLILRIEGRSPNDDAAMYRIKFGGSFIALTGQKVEDEPTVAKTTPDDSGIKVNSIGTIVAVTPKIKPTPKPVEPGPEPVAVVSSVKQPPTAVKSKTVPPAADKRSSTEVATVFGKKKRPPAAADTAPPKRETAATEPEAETVEPKPELDESKPESPAPAPPAAASKVTANSKAAASKTKAARAASKPPKAAPEPLEPKPDPLASIHLVVELKDGNLIERPMSEVQKFSVDKGVLTVIGKDGKIAKYSILDVSKVTIQ